MKWFALGLIVFIMVNFVAYLVSRETHNQQIQLWRKALYTFSLVGVGILIFRGSLTLTDWPTLLVIAGTLVFVDLGVLLTPNILKFMNAEFGYAEKVENALWENKRIFQATRLRVDKMAEMVQNAPFDVSQIKKEEDGDDVPELEAYLEEYANAFGLQVSVHEVFVLEGEEIEDGLSYHLQEIGQKHLLDLDTEAVVEGLMQQQVVSISEENTMLSPVFLEDRRYIVVIRPSKLYGMVLEVDGVHVAGLVSLYHNFG